MSTHKQEPRMNLYALDPFHNGGELMANMIKNLQLKTYRDQRHQANTTIYGQTI
jgi:hypothetical protein